MDRRRGTLSGCDALVAGRSCGAIAAGFTGNQTVRPANPAARRRCNGTATGRRSHIAARDSAFICIVPTKISPPPSVGGYGWNATRVPTHNPPRQPHSRFLMLRCYRTAMRLLFFLVLAIANLVSAEEKPAPVRQLIPWLLDEDAALKGILFSDVISATSGKRVIPIDGKDKDTARILAAIGKTLDAVLAQMNGDGSPAKKQKRVNEMSRHFVDAITAGLKAAPGFECDFPKTASGHIQRSGYPDIRLVDKATGRILYLDPKLYAKGSRHSSLRTFYFTPKRETNKVNDDAHHLIVGIEHEKTGAEVNFTRWELIDLSSFRVRLKAEFQGSNADMYREDAVVGGSGGNQ